MKPYHGSYMYTNHYIILAAARATVLRADPYLYDYSVSAATGLNSGLFHSPLHISNW